MIRQVALLATLPAHVHYDFLSPGPCRADCANKMLVIAASLAMANDAMRTSLRYSLKVLYLICFFYQNIQ